MQRSNETQQRTKPVLSYYNRLYSKATDAFKGDKSTADIRQWSSSKWNEIKSCDDVADSDAMYEMRMSELDEIIQKKKAKNPMITSWFSPLFASNGSNHNNNAASSRANHNSAASNTTNRNRNDAAYTTPRKTSRNKSHKKPTVSRTDTKRSTHWPKHKQNEIEKEISRVRIQLKSQKAMRRLVNDPDQLHKMDKAIVKKHNEMAALQKQLKYKQKRCQYSADWRKRKKMKDKKLRQVTGDLSIGRDGPGRPRQEELKMNEGLLEFYKVLVDTYIIGAADERRRSSVISSVQTLDQLLVIVFNG